jgi:hypothetical protein
MLRPQRALPVLPLPTDNLSVCKHETDGAMLTLLIGFVGVLVIVVALYVLTCVISTWFGQP